MQAQRAAATNFSYLPQCTNKRLAFAMLKAKS